MMDVLPCCIAIMLVLTFLSLSVCSIAFCALVLIVEDCGGERCAQKKLSYRFWIVVSWWSVGCAAVFLTSLVVLAVLSSVLPSGV